MSDSIVQPNTTDTDLQDDPVSDPEAKTSAKIAPLTVTSASPAVTIIWTPRFIVLFALTLVIGLTADCLFALGYGIRIIEPSWVLLGHVTLVAGGFGGIIYSTRSRWTRLGGVFGGVWVIFTGINLSLTLLPFDHTSPVIAYINVAMTSALFGTYICFSLEQTPLTRWDRWFFGTALLISCCVPILSFIFMPAENRSLAAIESSVAATFQILNLLVWWLRPSCWRIQPGTTFFLGMTPAILLILAFTSLGRSGQTNFFLSQVALLSLLLGLIRIWQKELQVLKQQQAINSTHL